jgi:glucose-6-phosphate isomerase
MSITWPAAFGVSSGGANVSAKFFAGEEIIEIRPDQLVELKRAAWEAPLKRARLCLHQDHADQVQEMVIAFSRQSYVRPHRHRHKTESFHVIEGELEVIFLDDSGGVIRRIPMGPRESGRTFLYRLCSSLWHTVVPLSEFTIIHETTTGPFIPGETEFAPWGPEDSDAAGVRAFLARVTACPPATEVRS